MNIMEVDNIGLEFFDHINKLNRCPLGIEPVSVCKPGEPAVNIYIKILSDPVCIHTFRMSVSPVCYHTLIAVG